LNVKTLLIKIISGFWNCLLRLIAYGPWPYAIHQAIIRNYKRIYSIEWDDTSRFKNLGDFFLREVDFPTGKAKLVSPAEALLLDGPRPIRDSMNGIRIKGLDYQWSEFPEWRPEFTEATYWNIYLAPPDYHWVHAPSDGQDVKAIRFPGLSVPVNQLGRVIMPDLYLRNERLSFQWIHPEMGHCWLAMVGAMGVSRIRSCVGEISAQWTPLAPIQKAQKLGGFELGSSALLVVERPGKAFEGLKKIRPGLDLIYS